MAAAFPSGGFGEHRLATFASLYLAAAKAQRATLLTTLTPCSPNLLAPGGGPGAGTPLARQDDLIVSVHADLNRLACAWLSLRTPGCFTFFDRPDRDVTWVSASTRVRWLQSVVRKADPVGLERSLVRLIRPIYMILAVQPIVQATCACALACASLAPFEALLWIMDAIRRLAPRERYPCLVMMGWRVQDTMTLVILHQHAKSPYPAIAAIVGWSARRIYFYDPSDKLVLAITDAIGAANVLRTSQLMAMVRDEFLVYILFPGVARTSYPGIHFSGASINMYTLAQPGVNAALDLVRQRAFDVCSAAGTGSPGRMMLTQVERHDEFQQRPLLNDDVAYWLSVAETEP